MQYVIWLNIGFRDHDDHIHDVSSSFIGLTCPSERGGISSGVLYFDYKDDAVSFIVRKFDAERIGTVDDDLNMFISEHNGSCEIDGNSAHGKFVYEFMIIERDKVECGALSA